MRRQRRDVPWLSLIGIVAVTMAGVGGLALIDLGYNEIRIGGVHLCNGFWCTRATVLFHGALYAAYAALGLLCVATLAMLWRYRE